MRQRMVVTDLTQMQADRICVGGYLEDGTSIRPVCRPVGPTRKWLRPTAEERVVPFSVLALTVGGSPELVAPHTEDRFVPTTGHRVIETLPEADCLALLNWSESPSVREIFGAVVHADTDGPWGRYVRSGEGARSLGAIRASQIQAVPYQFYPDRGRWDYRLRFLDASGELFQFAVVDLDFRRRLDTMRDDGLAPDRVSTAMVASLRKQSVYLRIGLARGWDKHPDRCYLQITGAYGFSP